MQKTITIIFIIALIVLAGSFFMYKNNLPPTPKSNIQILTPTNSNETITQIFTVTGQNFSFLPAIINARKGDRVKIIFKNTGGFHDFKIDEFNVATQKIQEGAEETVEFIADKTGSFEYYCSIGNHRAMGMKGTLIIK